MSLKRLVNSEDYIHLKEYFEEELEKVKTNLVNAEDEITVRQYQGEAKRLRRLTKLKESINGRERTTV